MEDFTIVNKTICLCAKRNSGKSELLKYIVSKEARKFDKIFAFCPTESINHFYEKSGLVKPECLFENYSEKWTDRLFKKLQQVNGDETKEKKKILLIYDDVCSDNNFHSNNPSFKRIFTKGRHYGISLIITTQYIYHIPPIARNNSDYMFVGQMNRSSIDILANEFLAGTIEKKEFIDMYNQNTKDYHFLCINNNSVKNNEDVNEIYGVVRTPENFIK
jgi:hypothetical protein